MKKLSLILLMLFTCSFAYSQDAEYYIEKANQKIEQGDYHYSLFLIEKAIELAPSKQWYYTLKAEVQFQLSDARKAINTAHKAILLDNKNSMPYNQVAKFYTSVGMSDSAMIMYGKAIKYAENDTIKHDHIISRGAAKSAVRKYEEALKDYQMALDFNPSNVAALNNIAATYDALGQNHKGIEYLKKVVDIDSTFIGAYINIGFIYSKMDSSDLAILYFDKALKINPKQALVYSNRGYAYYKKKEYTKALEDINYSIQLYPTNPYAYRNLALIYIALNKMQEACDALSYAKHYRFQQIHGNEVSELIEKYCKKPVR